MNHTQSTRKQIMLLLKTEGPLTVSELAVKLGVTEMAVRRHLNTLERDNLIHAKLLRQSMGRPTNQYFLTDQSDEHFPKSYHSFTLELLTDLEDQYGPKLIDDLFERREKRLVDTYQNQFQESDLRDRVKKLADLQDSKGYMVNWVEHEDGTYHITEHNCPIAQVANQYNQACSCELNWFRQLLKADVEQLECKAKGGQNCIYFVKGKKSLSTSNGTIACESVN
ncbi:helix-turn-helix transcriptional regulator [Hazenella coriacea]|uniref:Putative ArsR family transcriptional regulator n=1 Tax=Hazenella coriacea TaxID=1179467 RepID=A0A4R3LB28_9BACL|nr:metalloregulator ArsR/SmtB family transcription factor [Hazenella coriacea]TCS96922.1 putative ArsR family transcriptional regulator [Hazenella coriacea]